MSSVPRCTVVAGLAAGVLLLLPAAEGAAQIPPGGIQRPQAQLPAIQQVRVSDVCAFDIQVNGNKVARGILFTSGRTGFVGPADVIGPESRDRDGGERGIILLDGRVEPDRMRNCREADLRRASPDRAWVPVHQLAEASGDRQAFRVEEGRLQTVGTQGGRRPVTQRRAPAAGRATATPDGLSTAVVGVRGSVRRGADDEEDVQMFPVSDLMRSLGIEPGDNFIEPGDQFREGGSHSMDTRSMSLDLSPAANCALCAFDAFAPARAAGPAPRLPRP
jgi:hypothetical protein